MAHSLYNCKQCGQMFTHPRPQEYCPSCAETRHHHWNQVYDTLQKSLPKGGIHIEQLCQYLNITPKEVESFLLSGQLGTTADALLFDCPNCKQQIPSSRRNGRLCLPCSQEISNKTGVPIRNWREVRDEQSRLEPTSSRVPTSKGLATRHR